MAVEGNESNMNSRTTACTEKAKQSTSKSRCSGTTTGGVYCKIIRARSINIKKRQRPKITAALPMSSLLFSFGPTTTTRKKDNNDTTAMTDSILDNVLATIATTTSQHSEKTPQQQRQMQRVSFSTKTDIQYIPTRHEISSKEYKEVWYSRVELESISESCLEQIHSITTNRNNYFHFMGDHDLTRSGTNILDEEEESFCFRGLESFTPVASKAKNMNRSSCVQAVLNEQDRQKQSPLLQHNQDKDANDDHAEVLRMIYHGISSSSQLWAHAVALKDRREVEDMMMDDEECSPEKTSAILTKSLAVIVEEQQSLHGGAGGSPSRRKRVISRRYSSKQSSSCNAIQLSPKISTVKTMSLDGQEATPQMLMAIAA